MEYELVRETPTVEEFRWLRTEAGMSPRARDAVKYGLPNTLFGVTATHDGEPIGMGRIVGDGGCNYQIVDVAVLPEYQGRGVGSRIVGTLVDHIEETARPTAIVSLFAEVDGFYERFGFEYAHPRPKGMLMGIE